MDDYNRWEPIRLPGDWPQQVKNAVFHTISLAHTAMTWTRGWCVNSSIERVRLKARVELAGSEMDLLREEIRIKGARMRKVAPSRRPHYRPVERMPILDLRAVRGRVQRVYAAAGK